MPPRQALVGSLLLFVVVVSACLGGAPRVQEAAQEPEAEFSFRVVRHDENRSLPMHVYACTVVCVSPRTEQQGTLNVTNVTVTSLRYRIEWASPPGTCTHLAFSIYHRTRVGGGASGWPVVVESGASPLRDLVDNTRFVLNETSSLVYSINHRANMPADYWLSVWHNPAIQFRLIVDLQTRETVPADLSPPVPPIETSASRPPQSVSIPAPKIYLPVCA